MKRWIIVTIITVGALAIGFGVTAFYAGSTSRWAKTLTWENPSLAAVADGVYEGQAAIRMPTGTAAANTSASVRLTIRDHRYAAIEVVGPAPVARRMTQYAQLIISNQSLRPDAISGGTVTKSLVLMAASNAITRR